MFENNTLFRYFKWTINGLYIDRFPLVYKTKLDNGLCRLYIFFYSYLKLDPNLNIRNICNSPSRH